MKIDDPIWLTLHQLLGILVLILKIFPTYMAYLEDILNTGIVKSRGELDKIG